jgi:hypothetical protein
MALTTRPVAKVEADLTPLSVVVTTFFTVFPVPNPIRCKKSITGRLTYLVTKSVEVAKYWNKFTPKIAKIITNINTLKAVEVKKLYGSCIGCTDDMGDDIEDSIGMAVGEIIGTDGEFIYIIKVLKIYVNYIYEYWNAK